MGSHKQDDELITIGQLAKQAGLRTSALRFYEEQGLLTPETRTEAGYRLYRPEALVRLRFIQRAQHLGFSLDDMRVLLQTDDAADADVLTTAESRYLALEEEITRLLVQRHELQSFLHDLYQQGDSSERVRDMIMPQTDSPLRHTHHATVVDMFRWMLQRLDCRLTTEEGRAILESLRGQHVHVWQEGEAYQILVVSQDSAVAESLLALADLEESCVAHPSTVYQVTPNQEGYLLTATGPRAFLFARLFLTLESNSGVR